MSCSTTNKRRNKMKRIILVLSFALVSALSAGAQGKSPSTTSGATHSNAPAGTPAASKDRDKGTARAEDVGKGKKKGVSKSKKEKKGNTTPTSKK
jgi:protein-disulfide isomerase